MELAIVDLPFLRIDEALHGLREFGQDPLGLLVIRAAELLLDQRVTRHGGLSDPLGVCFVVRNPQQRIVVRRLAIGRNLQPLPVGIEIHRMCSLN
ncbi:MAG: hypothetical protein A2V98_05780 [Planctomycetes bacterium RBG_16_64_12]|nr:MAG: hypothetical protein A2V98_05780 [Planctomycetes bacterium RBG_16_64_12]